LFDVYHHSASVFVADFIGTPPTNFMDVEISSENGKRRLVNKFINLNLDDDLAKVLDEYNKREIVLGVRPENIEIVNEEPVDMSAACLVSEPQGSHQVIAIQLDKKIIKIVAPAIPKFKPGQVVNLRFKQETLRFFDPETTLTIET